MTHSKKSANCANLIVIVPGTPASPWQRLWFTCWCPGLLVSS